MKKSLPEQTASLATKRTEACKLLDVKGINTKAFVTHYH
jgi:hypothetical protein